MKNNPKKKRSLRGYQTALGIAMRQENQLRIELIRQRKRAEAVEEELRLALANIQHLRGVLGEWCPPRDKLCYRRACTVKILDDREFVMPIPPMHIHVTAKAPFGKSQHDRGYMFEMAVPNGARLDPRSAYVIHKALHELVDFVEKNPFGGCVEVDTFERNEK